MSEIPAAQSGAQGLRSDNRPHLGRAVKNGNIRFLSVSQLQLFDPETETGCPRRWVYSYVHGLKEAATDQQKAGSDEYAKQLEHYLTSGEDTLVPVLRAAKHLFPKPGNDLEVELPLGDIEKAIYLRECMLKPEYQGPQFETQRKMFVTEMKRLAGLTAADIPLTGAADFRHRRGWFIDSDGILRPEAEGLVVAEIGDLKTTSRINDYTSPSGRKYQGYAKTVEKVLWQTQMLGYGVHAADRYPNLTHVRLSHIYAQTKNGYAGVKRTGLLTVEEVRNRWRLRVEPVARQMIEAARVVKAEDVPVNTRACHSYHRDCPHLPYCVRPERSVADLLGVGSNEDEQGGSMSTGLFGDSGSGGSNGISTPHPVGTPTPAPALSAVPTGLFGGPTVAPPLPTTVMTDAERATKIAEEHARLAAEDKANQTQAPPSNLPSYGNCSGCGEALSPLNASRLSDGVTAKHIGCTATAAPPVIPHPAAVNPVDGPASDPIADAAPLSPEAVAAIEDPELRKRVELHATEARAREEEAKRLQQANTSKKASGKCPASGNSYTITQKETASRRKVCPGCNVERKIKDSEFSADFTSVTFAGHMLPKTEGAAAPTPAVSAAAAAPPLPTTAPPLPVSAPPLPASVAPPLPVSAPPLPAAAPALPTMAPTAPPLPTSPALAATMFAPPTPLPLPAPAPVVTNITNAAPQTAGDGVVLYVDVVFTRGGSPQSLEPYVDDVVGTLQRASGIDDLRYTPEKHELAFGRWKGALAAMVRTNPLPAGEYVIYNVASSEIRQVIVDALSPTCKRVVQASR